MGVNRAQRRTGWLAAHRGGRHGAGDRNPAPATPLAITIDIGEVTLLGLPRFSGTDVADSIRTELAGLIGSAGLPAPLRSAGHTDRVVRGPIRVGPGRSASVLGQRIAAAVLGGRGQ